MESWKNYTGHSLRSSSATNLVDNGVSIENLKRHGNWKSSTVAEEYIRDSTEFRNTIAENLIKKRKKDDLENSNKKKKGDYYFKNCYFKIINK